MSPPREASDPRRGRPTDETRRLRVFGLACAVSTILAGLTLASQAPATARGPAAAHAAAAATCPADLSAWRRLLGAEWIDCHRVGDLTTTNNPWTDPNDLTGMGEPPPGSGTLDSKYSTPTTPAVPGLQIDGYWPDGCNAFQPDPVATNKAGQPWFPGCTPPLSPGQTCFSGCHHDGQFVIRIPDGWNGRLVTAGTPGIRDEFSSDYIFSDYVLEKGWAYVSQDKGNMGADFYRDGSDEVGSCGTPWCPAAAIQEWTTRMRQATVAAEALLDAISSRYGLTGVTHSYAVGISNGGYQVRRALEADTGPRKLYDGGVDWEGTLFSNQENLFSYLPTSLGQWPGDVSGDPNAVQALAKVGFNPVSQPLWNYHWAVYWGLTQKIYRLEFDPEYTGYSCSSPVGLGSPCVSPPAETVPPPDPDANYNYAARSAALPALATRMNSVAVTGDINDRLITLQGDQDSLLPIRTDADLYARMVAAHGHTGEFRFYTVAGGNHVDPQFDDHYGIDSYGNTVLRPMLPCVHAAIDALDAWVRRGQDPPASATVPRSEGASADDLANRCSLGNAAGASGPGHRGGRLKVRIMTRSAAVRRGAVKLRLGCRGGAQASVCRGTLTLWVRRTARVRRTGRWVSLTHAVRLGRVGYAVGSGRDRPIQLRVNAHGMTLLRRARRHRIGVTATATVRGGSRGRRRVLLRLTNRRRPGGRL